MVLERLEQVKDEHHNDKSRDDKLAESFHQLSESICGLAGVMLQLTNEVSHNNNNQAVLHRIAQMEERIMSKISEFAAAQAAFNTRQAAAIDSIVASQTGIAGDFAELKRLIEELQNSPGGITPEDQALLDEIQATNEAATAKLEAQATALAALDAQNPPAVPPTP